MENLVPEALASGAVLAVTFAFLRFIASQNGLARKRDEAFIESLDKMADRHDVREKESNQVLRELTTYVMKQNGKH